MNIVSSVVKEIEDRRSALQTLWRLEDTLEKDHNFFFWVSGISIFELSRKEVFSVIKALGGKWNKSFGKGGHMVYKSPNSIPITIERSTSELPPTCRLIKKVIECPAKPAYTEEVFEIECDAPEDAEVDA
jgi:hypothetical protein